MDNFNKYAVPIGLALVILALGWLLFGGGADDPIARGTYNVPVYVEQGGAKMVVESGGAVEVQSGGLLAVTPGATLAAPVLRYATSGTQIVCGTQTITDTANVTHGLTTPAYGLCSLNQTIAGDAVGCNATVSGATVTVKVRNSALTPAANAAGASINWCVIGTP